MTIPERLPARLLPLLYVGSAHISLYRHRCERNWHYVVSGAGFAEEPAMVRRLRRSRPHRVSGRMIIGMEARLLPMVTRFWAYEASRYEVAPWSPQVMRDRTLQAIVYGGWTVGVPVSRAPRPRHNRSERDVMTSALSDSRGTP